MSRPILNATHQPCTCSHVGELEVGGRGLQMWVFCVGQDGCTFATKGGWAFILTSVTHRHKQGPPHRGPYESFWRADAASSSLCLPFLQRFWSLKLRTAGCFSLSAPKLWLISLVAPSAGEKDPQYVCGCPISVVKWAVKGSGNRDAFSFQDKSKQTLKLTRFCCLWLIHTVCILALLKSVALFSLVYWELSFMLMNLLCRKSDKRNWRAAQGWVINKWGLSLLSGDAAHDLDSGASRPHPGTSTPAPCLGALFTDYS